MKHRTAKCVSEWKYQVPGLPVSWYMVLSEQLGNLSSVTTNVFCLSASSVLAKLRGEGYMFAILILLSSFFLFVFIFIWEGISSNILHI